MNFQELIIERQSTRSYLDTPVEEEKLQQCIEAARLAPSACNAQPWKFIVIEDPELRSQVAENAASFGMNKFAVQAPIIVAITLEKPNMSSRVGSVLKGKEYTLMDIGFAVSNFCHQATELGLSTCIIGWFNEKETRKTLNIPSSKRIPLIITIGYSDAEIRSKVRKKKEEMYSKNSYLGI